MKRINCPLQKRLKEMEKENPSSNRYIQGWRKFFSDKKYFSERNKRNIVGEMPQKNVIYAPRSLDESVAYFEQFVRYGDDFYLSQGKPSKLVAYSLWCRLSRVVEEAKQGVPERTINSSLDFQLRIFKYDSIGRPLLRQEINPELIELISEIQKQGIKENGEYNLNCKLFCLRGIARDAWQCWDSLKHDSLFREIQELSKEMGKEVDIELLKEETKERYFSIGKNHVRESIDKEIFNANFVSKLPGADPSSRIKTIENYIKDFDLNLKVKVEELEGGIKHLELYW